MMDLMPPGRAPAGPLCIHSFALALGSLLVDAVPLSAQTVSQDIPVRDSALAGSATEFTAAFEAGASYVAWRDTRNHAVSNGDIYVQKIGSGGELLWEDNGLGVCTAGGNQRLPAIIPDGSGGAVVVWLDGRGDRWQAIFGQRISASGVAQWLTDGEFVGVALLESPRPFIHRASDGAYLVTWWDAEPFFDPDDDMLALLAQKLGPDGALLWDPDGSGPGDTWGPGIEVMNGILRGRSVPDDNGGCLAFGKLQNGRGFRFQRVAANQSTPWAAPVDFEVALADVVPFAFGGDGAGGVVVVYRAGSTLRGLRVAGDGSLAWGPGGIDIVTSNLNTTQTFAVAGDGQGGAFVAWIASSPRDVRVQYFSSNGTAQWAAEGVIVPDLSATERDPGLLPDGRGGVYLSFDTSSSVRGQRLDRFGAAQWFAGGSNGLHLGTGDMPLMGAGATGPIVVYSRGFGLVARRIDGAEAGILALIDLAVLSSMEVTLTLNGGEPGAAYEVLRAPVIASPLSQTPWIILGTIEPGDPWVDPAPPSAAAFYAVRERTP